jgi:hypothetical protein
MRLTRKEIEEKPELSNLTGWLKAMQVSAKSETPPTFKVNGPRTLSVRLRRATQPRRIIGGGLVKGDTAGNRAFMGGEELRLSDVFQHVDHAQQEVLLQATFIPASLTLATEVTSITLPFDEAVGALDGFETWMANITPVEKPKKISKEERIEQAREENESYGAW